MGISPGNESIGFWFPEVLESVAMAIAELFCARLGTISDLCHPIAVLPRRMPWPEIKAALEPGLAHRNPMGRLVEGADLFGTTAQLTSVDMSSTGRPTLAANQLDHRTAAPRSPS